MEDKRVMNGPVVLVRGAGEQASGVGWALAKAGFRVVMTEVAKPLMVRWPVCFGTAVAEGKWQVEGIPARRVEDSKACEGAWSAGEIPVLVDPDLKGLPVLNPSVLVDAIMAKRNLGTRQGMASRTIGLGPGFTAGTDVDVVVETNRGHHLGRLIYSGAAEPNTGIPGVIAGFSKERVIYSPKAGLFKAKRAIGEQVLAGDCLGTVDDGVRAEDVFSSINGVLRGLLRTDTPVAALVKIGDVDPRGHEEYCWTISEKARAIGTAVLLGIMELEQRPN
ncbi:selenium-dependent molybdenum cofactor biosynthesis protein YqeB [Desulfosporosinus metallidurans]|uniref:Xanthine and CO dehydrogenases maturation factor, XdhC/CoxF family n=1 Tax=Desulfosporosinus metallidurans TaxID=1888891 RepID=A0A1Q8QZ88_9FIRM|nr:selenium-dependent molybdenum cofactor biosynthesis protein YqeB [Desulfosporosinus metallidurans]OLN32689.1 Xanthine and CO dehydrogenases maturation factor, XdhC/CoxF family [Desulfosporosinus metallidurans]